MSAPQTPNPTPIPPQQIPAVPNPTPVVPVAPPTPIAVPIAPVSMPATPPVANSPVSPVANPASTPPVNNVPPQTAAATVMAPAAPVLQTASVPAPQVSAETKASSQELEVKKAKSVYFKARINRIFGRLRRHVAFFILCMLFLYTNVWMFARAWQQEKAGENENWFHEGLFLVLMVLALVVFYYRLYRKSDVFQKALAKRESAEKAAREARLKLEEEQKKQAFMGLIKDFQSANTYEQKSTTMAKLLTVGLESNLLRQESINLLCDLNQWMVDHKTFLVSQNLIVWRLKSSLFEQSERFQVDGATQDLSIKSVNIIEAIVKKHLSDFISGRTKSQLDLSGKTIPTITLTAQTIPPNSLKLDNSNLWQASFAETKLDGLSFENSDLQAASFWRAQLDNIDMKGTNLQFSKLRTNLQSVANLTAKQFFSTKEWELCYLNNAQQEAFFADTAAMPPNAKSEWDSAEPRRRKLYFHLLKQQADALD
ncbi:pentapeptide repeat-containing protein [bacterium]|nr:pentapeptide repeat-containing protein [bacterium]NCQ55374.1 pentapeptide repeat-containing protein [Candidatus Parcubacteria bacterium]NCS67736.1 pentapeptide repeat-containing protein [Candidatus Peregrinibacteria bacterium]NCS96450.1 pentapeptide repeat-containing protein [bacterium]